MKILKSLMCLGLVLAAGMVQAQMLDAGKITEVEGSVSVIRGAQSIAAKMGTGILVGDEVSTGPASRAKIWFRDQSVITLAEKSRFKVDALDYNPGVNRRSMFTLVSGKARAMVSGWFGKSQEEQYQIRALSTVAGVRGSGVIVEVQGQGQNAAAFFGGLSGTITLWNVNNPSVKISLPVNFFLQVLNGQIPGIPQEMAQNFLEQFNQGFFIGTGSGGERNEQIFQQITFTFPALPGGEGGGGGLPGNLGDNLGNSNNNYLNPADLIFQEPPGFTIINIRINESDILPPLPPS